MLSELTKRSSKYTEILRTHDLMENLKIQQIFPVKMPILKFKTSSSGEQSAEKTAKYC